MQNPKSSIEIFLLRLGSFGEQESQREWGGGEGTRAELDGKAKRQTEDSGKFFESDSTGYMLEIQDLCNGLLAIPD